jgi:hypothetical protein
MESSLTVPLLGAGVRETRVTTAGRKFSSVHRRRSSFGDVLSNALGHSDKAQGAVFCLGLLMFMMGFMIFGIGFVVVPMCKCLSAADTSAVSSWAWFVMASLQVQTPTPERCFQFVAGN